MAQTKQSGKKDSGIWFDRLSGMKQDLVCAGILLVIVYFVFWKAIPGNMVFSDSGDQATYDYFQAGIQHLRETEHADPLWIPYLFSGMPTYAGLLFPNDLNFVRWITLKIGYPLFIGSGLSWFIIYYFFMGLFMYVLTRRLGFSPIPSLLAGITVMLNPAALSLAPEGHASKLITLSYVPLLFLLTVELFKKRNALSLGLLAAVTGTLFLSRHPQVAFYGLLLIGSYLAYELAQEVRRAPMEGAKKALLFVAAMAIGFAIYWHEFSPTKEYSTFSIRGGGEPGSSQALDYDYATSWSFHPLESITYVIPSAFGFRSQYFMDVQGQLQPIPTYWGYLPFTNWPAYVGIVPLILAVLALTYRRDKLAWFLAGFSVLVFFISFGKYLPIVYDLFFNYVPYFNKFRTPILIQYLIPVTFGILAAGGMTYLGDLIGTGKDADRPRLTKRMRTWAIALGAIVVLGFIGKGGMKGFLSDFMFSTLDDQRQGYPPEYIAIFHDKRFELFWNYFEWVMLQGALLFGLAYLYLKGSIRRSVMMFGLAALLTVDLVAISSQYIEPKPASEAEIPFKGDPTVEGLSAMSDTTLFRVFPTWGVAQYDNSLMSYHLQMITGYSPAKLRIYQDVIESCFVKGNRKVFDMLNTKYFLAKQGKRGEEKVVAQLNPDCLPRAWFVDSFVVSGSKAQTLGILNSDTWEPRTTAILEKEPAPKPGKSNGAAVTSFQYASGHISIAVNTPNPALLVVSEIYYPGGWKATIDGAEAEIYKTNHILRSVLVPSGTHTIEMTFAPKSYESGLLVSETAWGITLLLIVVGVVQLPWVRSKLKRG